MTDYNRENTNEKTQGYLHFNFYPQKQELLSPLNALFFISQLCIFLSSYSLVSVSLFFFSFFCQPNFSNPILRDFSFLLKPSVTPLSRCPIPCSTHTLLSSASSGFVHVSHSHQHSPLPLVSPQDTTLPKGFVPGMQVKKYIFFFRNGHLGEPPKHQAICLIDGAN